MIKEYKLLKVGTDCELFLKDLSGHPLPVIGLLGGTKSEPRAILDEPGYAVQEDNVMAEFNIPAREDVTSFVTSINKALGYLQAHFHELDFIQIDFSASQMFDPKVLEHPQAKQIGCEPDFCAWTKTMNKIDNEHPLLAQMRTCGGHEHLSYFVNGGVPTLEERIEFVKMQDLFQGVASVILDKDQRRKQLYGKGGAFRPKKYSDGIEGHEYRVLSNFWVKTNELKEWMFNQTVECFTQINERGGYFKGMFEGTLGSMVQECINSNDESKARFLCKEFGVRLP